MLILPPTIKVPLRQDNDNTIRIGQSRVLLEIVICAFQRGDTPEGIVENYPTLRLDDVYAVLAYYLQHKGEVEAYIKQVENDAQVIRQKIEARQPQVSTIREKLLKQLD